MSYFWQEREKIGLGMCTENLIFSLFREQEMRSNASAEGKASIKQWE